MNSLMKLAQGSKPGKDSNAYKGASVSYSAKHKRQSNKKKASKCIQCGSTKNLVWATVHGSNDKKHKTLCGSCHAKYDNHANNINKTSALDTFIKMATKYLDMVKEAEALANLGTPASEGQPATTSDIGVSSKQLNNISQDEDAQKNFWNQRPDFNAYSYGNFGNMKHMNRMGRYMNPGAINTNPGNISLHSPKIN